MPIENVGENSLVEPSLREQIFRVTLVIGFREPISFQLIRHVLSYFNLLMLMFNLLMLKMSEHSCSLPVRLL
jgi:hypothetical protein